MTPSRSSSAIHQRCGRSIPLLVLAGLLIGVVAAEVWVRVNKPTPRAQVVRGFGLHMLDGVPVWEYADDRYNRECAERYPQRIRILFFGSSITFGSDLTAPEVFTTGLEARLNEVRPTPGFCVLNFAQPGFSFEQKRVIAQREVARYRPALVFWEDWVEWLDYKQIGDAAYGVGGFVVRPDGFIGIAAVPDTLNRFLFLNSRLYEYATLTFGESSIRMPGPSEEEKVREFATQRLVQIPQLAQAAGAKLVMYLAPPLDRSFAETAATLPGWHAILLEFAEKHGVRAFPLQRELVDRDYLDLRLDPCCHYNAAGHRALVPIMERAVSEELDRAPG